MKGFRNVVLLLAVVAGLITWAATGGAVTTTNIRQGGTATLGGGTGLGTVTIERVVNYEDNWTTVGDIIQVFNVPAGTVVLGVYAKCVEANGATATVDIGDADSATGYFSNFNMNSEGGFDWSDTTTGLDKAKWYASPGIISVKSDHTIGTGSLLLRMVAIQPGQ